MSDSPGRNRLDEEASPYLREHADNPVHWQPWDEQALQEARERDVPIFLSIGYSACHWCHVMEEESFQDETVAEVLNENFVPIKVDREERPDLDRIYQTICQLVSGRGGWPLSVWLTPEGEPFYVGTYFPPESRQGVPGFVDLLRDIANSWGTDREEMENRADQWTRALTDQLEETPEHPGEAPTSEVFQEAVGAALRAADREQGGFGSGGPKFPQPWRLHLLLRAAEQGNDDAGSVVARTLDAMAAGGLYDHVGGGFHRYATDRSWTVPHFEKMLYDNAELSKAYLAAYQAAGDPQYARVAQETFAFVERELTHPDGGFYSTLDAESEAPEEGSDQRAEGIFYVWTPDQVHDAIDDETTADLVCDRYGITKQGNFEGSRTVLTVSETVDDLADSYDLSAEEIQQRLMSGRAQLFDAREANRPRPPRDEKILAGWNGLMISAFATGAQVLDSVLVENAEDALGFVREHLWDEDERRLARRFKDGDVKGSGYLEDYAFLARGAFDLYQATGDVDHLAFALDLARVIEDEFWDEDAGTLYFTPESGEQLVTRPQELQDQSTPSSIGATLDLFLDLDGFAPARGFGDIAEQVLATHSNRIKGSPMEHVTLALAANKRDRGTRELTIAAEEMPDAWQDVLADTYLPGAVVSRRPATADELDAWLDTLGLDEAPPIWKERDARDGEPTVYACEAFTCSEPKHDIVEALAWFRSGER